MKVLVDIPDKQADFGLEVLRSLSFIKKAQPIATPKAQLIEEIKQAVEEIKLDRMAEVTFDGWTPDATGSPPKRRPAPARLTNAF